MSRTRRFDSVTDTEIDALAVPLCAPLVTALLNPLKLVQDEPAFVLYCNFIVDVEQQTAGVCPAATHAVSVHGTESVAAVQST